MKRVIVLGLVSLVALLGFQKMSNSIEEFWTGTPHCDRSPHDRIADGVILEKIRKDAFGDPSRRGTLEDAIRDGRVHWTWHAAPGKKWPSEYRDRSVYSASAIVIRYMKQMPNSNGGWTLVPLSHKNAPGIRRDMRLFGYGFDACGNLIGGRDGIERSGYTGDKR